jgi:hypothetical protein
MVISPAAGPSGGRGIAAQLVIGYVKGMPPAKVALSFLGSSGQRELPPEGLGLGSADTVVESPLQEVVLVLTFGILI